LAVRDHLREHPDSAAAYAELKKALPRKFPEDIDSYVDGKAEFILKILEKASFSADELRPIAGRHDKG
tara:strand:- start:332 stop:535 length:204 start_codon:yes stop_codon:yes gene_type:complete